MHKRPLRPGKPPVRRTPIAPRNEERYQRSWLRAFGSEARVQAIRRLRCIVPGCRAASENAHTRTRRWASWREVFPCCFMHHREQHRIGMQTFMAKYGVDPYARAAELAERIPA